MSDEVRGGPVAAFCADLSELRRSSGRSPAALAHELKMSRGHLYTILNGEVKRPPDWSRVVEPLLRACGADDDTIAAWRTRHGVLEEVYEQLRRHQPATPEAVPATPEAVPEATEPVPAVACPLPHRTRPRWQVWVAQAVALLLAAVAGAVVSRLTTSEPAAASCADANRKVWWNSDPRVADPGGDPQGFRSSARGGTEDPWELIVGHSCVDIVRGRKYLLAFTATASMPVTITVRVQDERPPQYAASLDERVTLGPEPERFTYRFMGALTTPESELLFQLGGHPTDFSLAVSGLSLTVV